MIRFQPKLELKLDPNRWQSLGYFPKQYFVPNHNKSVCILPWKRKFKEENDYNISLTISIKSYPEKGFFELIKDKEPLFYSCHFKTQTKSGFGKEKGFSSEPISKEEKELLFKILINLLPKGGKLSTWGHVTPGGLHALMTLGNRSNGTLKISGWRTLDQNKIPIWEKY